MNLASLTHNHVNVECKSKDKVFTFECLGFGPPSTHDQGSYRRPNEQQQQQQQPPMDNYSSNQNQQLQQQRVAMATTSPINSTTTTSDLQQHHHLQQQYQQQQQVQQQQQQQQVYPSHHFGPGGDCLSTVSDNVSAVSQSQPMYGECPVVINKVLFFANEIYRSKP